MSNLFSGISGRFRGGSSKTGNQPKNSGVSNNGQGPSPTPSLQGSQSSTSLAPRVPALPVSPSLSQTMSMEESGRASPSSDPFAIYNLPRPKPLWLNANYAKHIVKGNFMTLSTRPKTVEQGEWIAHQVVEHWRNLSHFLRVIYDKEEDKTTICNAETCPRMSAGANHSFTWLNNQREPVEIPAPTYLLYVQRWINGKILDQGIFPTDLASVSYAYSSTRSPTLNAGANQEATTNVNAPLSQLAASSGDWIGKNSGFPEDFIDICQTIFRQMFRLYSHIYWNHFVEPFYHLGLEKPLNSCFSHFLLTAVQLDMLKHYDLEPMQPLIDLWAAAGTFSTDSKVYQLANLKAGERLLALSGTPRS